jgi:hypothetical protein
MACPSTKAYRECKNGLRSYRKANNSARFRNVADPTGLIASFALVYGPLAKKAATRPERRGCVSRVYPICTIIDEYQAQVAW